MISLTKHKLCMIILTVTLYPVFSIIPVFNVASYILYV